MPEYEFGPFRVLPEEGRLLRDGQPVSLAPRAFDTLLVLLRNSGRLVSKQALMDAVWPDTFVEDGNLAFNISVLRKALGDGADRRYIETVPRRGYRFVGTVGTPSIDPASAPTTLVGRESETSALRGAWVDATRGRGLVVCVTGEAGLGKTTLVERFLLEPIGASARVLLRGRCSEPLAGAGTHLPLLEAFDDVLRGESSELAERVLRSAAPSWHTLVARGTVGGGDGASPERLKRELLAFLRELGAHAPVVLVIDDLHWADVSTSDLLSYLGHRVGDLPLLIVLCYRRSELLRERHPFAAVELELTGRGLCRDCSLGLFGPGEVQRYLDSTFPRHRFPADFAAFIHATTDGNPLFVVDILRDLRGQAAIVRDGDGFSLAKAVKDIARTLPLSVRAVIERKLAHLDEPARQLLSAACVQGHAFDSTVLAAVVDQPTDTVEARLAELERAHALIQRVAERELPDGSLSLRCRFVHALYHDALLSDLPPSRRASISRAVAIEMIRRYADAAEELSAQLGDLLETGRDFEMAASYFLTAARVAVAAGSYPEAAALARRGLANLERNAASAQRDAREMALQTMLGVASMSMEGFASRNVGRIYERALALSRNLGPTPELFPVLGGLWLFHVIRSQLVTARELAETILTAAERSGQPAQLAEAHQAVGITLMDMGDLRDALTHFRRSIELQEQEQQPYGALQYTLAPAVGARFGAARVLVPLGRPDTALAEANEGLALARRLGHASSLGIGLNFAAIVHCLRGEPDAAEALAAEAIAVSSEHGLPQTLAWGLFWQGWARTERGDREAIEQMRAAVEGLRAAGSWISVPIFLGLLAEAVRRSGDPVQALELLDEGLLQAATSCDLYGEAELHLFRGHALLDLRRSAEARAAIQESLDVARRQAAPWWELRAAVAWTRAFPTGDGCAREALGAALEKLATVDEGGGLSLLAEARARYAAG